MRRLWSFALLVVGVAAFRTAHLPIVPGDGCAMCGIVTPTSLADSGLHIPALLVVLGAALDLLASFAPPPSPLPRAIAGRRAALWIPLASPARLLLESSTARHLSGAIYVPAVLVMLVGLGAVAQPLDGARPAGGNYLAVAALLVLRPTRRDADRASE